MALEMLANPRVRDEIGNIALVAEEDRVFGPGASYVMASFTHINPRGSRFSDGSYGVYYAASDIDTALAETIHHFQEFAGDAQDPPRSEDMRVLVGSIKHDFEDVAALPEGERSVILDTEDYTRSRLYAARLRETGASGIVYPSVRRSAGECVGAFKPKVVGIPVQERHLQYHWDGDRVDRYFDYSLEQWINL